MGSINYTENKYHPVDLQFFAARIPIEVLAKFDYACRIYGKKKQVAIAEALEQFSTKIIVEYMQKDVDI